MVEGEEEVSGGGEIMEWEVGGISYRENGVVIEEGLAITY